MMIRRAVFVAAVALSLFAVAVYAQGVPAMKRPPVSYTVYRCIDQGGIRDQATGEWLEAFRLLVPKGWSFQGGLRWIANEKSPEQLSRTDLLMPVKSDYAVISPDGRYALRSYPAEYWVDPSRTPLYQYGGGFRQGDNYNGMIVSPVARPERRRTMTDEAKKNAVRGYLESAFPGCVVEFWPEAGIPSMHFKVSNQGAEHHAVVALDFLETHDSADIPSILEGFTLADHLRDLGSETVFVGRGGLALEHE